MTEPSPTALAQGSFAHPALFYRDQDEYLDGTLPFILDGYAAREPVAVAVPAPRLALLRSAVREAARDAAARVHWLDMSEAGRNPGRIIPGVLRAFADRHAAGRVRIIGEPIWPGRSATEYPACVQHEALINLAFAGRSVTILCPYDVAGLGREAVEDARTTHPVIVDRGGERASADFAPERVIEDCNRPLPERPDVEPVPFDLDTIPLIRELARRIGGELGLGERRAGDLELAVNELAANSARHGGGTGVLRVWSENGHVVCEVRDAGRITDPLVGRIPVGLSTDGGRGVLMVNHLADLVRLRTGPEGTTVRAYIRI
ncbi:anti-sigma factor RsbA family regulatory protein [Actinomadura sp. 9N407]|uniref:anti-sigma factor RsbA family regulatory protein n=1 Tax=Actinomadura sp. 9N407 TaxID=3375154 RepID=UPI0037A27959